MLILSIESSCDETAAAVICDGRRVLSDIVYSQIEQHKIYGGVVPEIASRKHVEKIGFVVQQAIEKAGISMNDINAVAVTYAPGLIGALLSGISFAKSFAYVRSLPLIPVHHLRGHVAANYIAHQELEPPFLALIVSGGHSHIVMVNDYTSYEILGRTRDDAAGEAYDKVSRVLGLGYPGGVAIEKAAAGGNPHAYKLPVTEFEDCIYDFSFSGLKTNVINLIHNANQSGEKLPTADIAAAFNQTVADTLASKFKRAASDRKADKLVVAGGVAANSRLRSRLSEVAAELGVSLYIPPVNLCGDNAAMIGAQSYYEYLMGNIAGLSLNGYATMSICQNYSDI